MWWPLFVFLVYSFATADELSGWFVIVLMAGHGAQYFVGKKLVQPRGVSLLVYEGFSKEFSKNVPQHEGVGYRVLSAGVLTHAAYKQVNPVPSEILYKEEVITYPDGTEVQTKIPYSADLSTELWWLPPGRVVFGSAGLVVFFRRRLAAAVSVVPTEWLDRAAAAFAPEVWLVLGLGLTPLAVLAGSVGFYFWLRRPVDMDHHPFVRFPWLVGVAAAAAAAYRGDFPVGWVLTVWGSMFLSCHLFHFCRRAYEFDPPGLPPGYEVSGLPAAVVATSVFTIDSFHWLGWYEFVIFPFGLFRFIQMAYGAYFVWCYLVDRERVTPALAYVTFPVYYAVGPWAAVWKDLGVGGKSATIGTVGAAVIATGTALSNHRIEVSRQAHQTKLFEYKLNHHNEAMWYKLNHHNEEMRQKLAYQAKDYADKREHEYLVKGMNYDRVGDDFFNVSRAGFFSSPKQTSRPGPPAEVLPKTDDVTLYSPHEPLVDLTWDYVGLVVAGAVLVTVWWGHHRRTSKHLPDSADYSVSFSQRQFQPCCSSGPVCRSCRGGDRDARRPG